MDIENLDSQVTDNEKVNSVPEKSESDVKVSVKRRRRRKQADSSDSERAETGAKADDCKLTSDGKRSTTKRRSSSKEVNKADQKLNKSFKSTVLVHEAPYVGSYAKKLFGVFKPVCKVNEFIQVEYMKTGFGLVKGYVLVEDIEKVVQNR